jgi:hypothetical protein
VDGIVDWVRWEMKRRGYEKPIIISDTAPGPFIAWGPATVCNRPAAQMGLLVFPATENDRCRLASFFTKLVNGDTAAIHWTQGITAADMVERTLIAAARGVSLINTAFVEDLVFLKLKAFGAGAGTSAWSGFVDVERNERRAGFYALKQLADHLKGFRAIDRVESVSPGVRLYQITYDDGTVAWAGWLEPEGVLLPGDRIPSRTVRLTTSEQGLVSEPVITHYGQREAERTPLTGAAGTVNVTLTSTPVFVSRRAVPPGK